MKTELEKLFDLFVGKEQIRPEMLSPFEYEGKIYATDAHVLIRMDKSYCDFKITNPDFLKCGGNIIPDENQNEALKIDKSVFDKYRTEDEYTVTEEEVECSTCHGNGEVEWEFDNYTMDADCPVCEGEGISEKEVKEKTGNKIFANDVIVKVENCYFKLDLFYKLVEVMNVLGDEVTLISIRNNYSGVMFRINFCEVLLMPYKVSDEKEFTVIKLL